MPFTLASVLSTIITKHDNPLAHTHISSMCCIRVLLVCHAGGDTTVRVWRASDLSLVRVLRGHRGSVLCLLAVGNVLLSGARDNTIRCGRGA